MNLEAAKQCLDKIISKARVHLYKPIQVAEILHYDRCVKNLNLLELEDYRTQSRKWRDEICSRFLDRTSSSSARYQDDLFNKNAVPPKALYTLSIENKKTSGMVEAYIYEKFKTKHSQMRNALSLSQQNAQDFYLDKFLSCFTKEPGLKRSLDKIYEIIVYSIFLTLIEELKVMIEVSVEVTPLLNEFEDFTQKIIGLNSEKTSGKSLAKVYRAGVTNAADRGLDMWANFGPAIQIKHLTLDENQAQDIVSGVSSDQVIIVCKKSEKTTIESLLVQIGWKNKIQSIITEDDLIKWYEKALRGNFKTNTAEKLMNYLRSEIELEFPISHSKDFDSFCSNRGYSGISFNGIWKS